MYQHRQILVCMREGRSDRDSYDRSPWGAKKIAQVREIDTKNGWLAWEAALPDEQVMAFFLDRKKEALVPSNSVSTLELWQNEII